MTHRVAAVDFGATSIRVAVVDLDGDDLVPEVVHRHPHQAVAHADGSLRWDWDRLLAETERGLELALAGGPIASIGVDTWGVDYGLVDGAGRLLSPPHSYRSHRTDGHRATVDAIGEARLYEIAGLQLQPFNTLFQLAAHDPDELAAAAHVVLLPDLVVHHLTGTLATERTIAGTTALLDVRAGTWADELLAAAGIQREQLPELVDPGTPAGSWRGIPVVRVASHDTASAVASVDPGEGEAFVASGTWLLVGRQQPAPDTSADARAENFTNELGLRGRIRFLKNLAGFWLIEECRRQWGDDDPAALLAAAADVEPGDLVDVTDPRFLAPADMDAEVRAASGLDAAASRTVVARTTVESMAAGTARVLDRLGTTGTVHLVGGGTQVPLLVDALERHAGRTVAVGPAEAAVIGNALVQRR